MIFLDLNFSYKLWMFHETLAKDFAKYFPKNNFREILHPWPHERTGRDFSVRQQIAFRTLHFCRTKKNFVDARPEFPEPLCTCNVRCSRCWAEFELAQLLSTAVLLRAEEMCRRNIRRFGKNFLTARFIFRPANLWTTTAYIHAARTRHPTNPLRRPTKLDIFSNETQSSRGYC